VPGDGIQTVWRELMGRKRYAYAELTGEVITARKALALGMIVVVAVVMLLYALVQRRASRWVK